MTSKSDLVRTFQQIWGASPQVFQAPGRVNLIGEHTDYNEGFVLPAAIQFRTRVAVAQTPERHLKIKSAAYSDEADFDLDEPHPAPRKHWSDYTRGVALALEQEGFPLQGARLLIESDVPQGAGLSSSAALEVASALAFLSAAGATADLRKIAHICRRAENEFVGIHSGVMDQFASCFGRTNCALLLDCRSLEVRYVSVPENMALMVCNTMVKHELASSEYNARRKQCEQGVATLSKFLPGVRALRDVTANGLRKYSAELDTVVYRRCRHVVEENRRVLAAVEALERNDLPAFGELMTESHQSLRLDFEVSCPELDAMCEFALESPGVHGARMIGGGFGGCVLALVDKSAAREFEKTVAQKYIGRTGIACAIYECFASEGAGPAGDGEQEN